MSEPSSTEGSATVTSDLTQTSSIQQDDIVPSSNKKPAETESEPTNAGTEAPADEPKDDRPMIADKVRKKQKKDKLLVDSSSDSDSDTFMDSTVTRRAAWISSEGFYKGFKEKLKIKAQGKDSKNQAPKLVKGLVDYLRVLEDRIEQLEVGTVAKLNNKNKEKEEDEAKKREAKSHDSTVEIAVKFFNSAAYLKEDGSFPDENGQSEKGTFTCSHDTQQLIRVLYFKSRDERAKPSNQADSEPPSPEDIDILTFGVSSEAISAFFANQLDIDTDKNHLIRFGKPFRPLIRHLSHVREQLKKLETNHRYV